MLRVLLWAALLAAAVTDDHVPSDDRVFGFLGGDSVLPCLLPDHTKLSLLEWLRPDLGPDAYLLFYREQKEHHEYQHPRFSQRVVLLSTDLENGDLSVKLKNLTLEDTGTYSCVVRTSDRRTISSSVHLEVTEAQPRAVTVVITLTGRDKQLQCVAEVSEGAEVLVLEWTQQRSGHYVLLYRDERVLPQHQHPTYKNRVELRDPELNSGDLTILMKNISSEDTGVYQCKALIEAPDGQRDQHSQIFHLKPLKPTGAQSGQDHVLLCASPPGGAKVLELQWTREGSHGDVLWHKDGRLREEHQNKVFKNRVELRDPQLSSGDMSLSLKNISSDDSGVYRCHFEIQTSDGAKEDHSRFIQLTVSPGVKASGEGSASNAALVGVVASVSICVLGIIVTAIVLIKKNTKICTSDSQVI